MGAGFHGGFGGTTGANAPVHSLGNVRYSRKKTEGYLLNPNHPTGGGKAKFMQDVLGYTQSDAKLFHRNVVSSLIGKIPTKTEETPYGTKYTYRVSLAGKKGTSVSANVVVVIQKDHGRTTHRIITVYPDKKEK